MIMSGDRNIFVETHCKAFSSILSCIAAFYCQGKERGAKPHKIIGGGLVQTLPSIISIKEHRVGLLSPFSF
jgi:hypothetical protein